jgi:cytoskeleton protein RodZ
MELEAGPGLHLRQHREHASLSIEEVAARLHLDTRTLGNLEADNYDELPAPTFVRGYLRSYARLLDIAPEPIIDSFDRRGLEPPPLVADISASDEARSSDAPMRMVTFGIIAISVALIIAWGTQQGLPWLDTVSGPDSSDTQGDFIPPLRPGTDGEVRLPGQRDPADLSNADTGTATNNSALATSAALGTSVPIAVPLPAVGSQNTAADGAATGLTPVVTEGPVAPSGEPGVGHLVLRVRRDSWIEVYDRAGERLYYSTARAGDSIDLQAPEPLKVLLGFARGVQVEFNGQTFDPSPFTTRGLARFSVGG